MTELTMLLAAVLSVSLVINGDFEDGLRSWAVRHGWYEQPKGAGLSEVLVSEGEGHDGGKALKIVGKNNRGIAMQVFPAYPGRYRVSGWIRCQGLGKARAGVLLEWMSRDGKWLRGGWAVQVSGDQGWKRFETTLEAHPDTRSVHFDLLTTAPNTGVVWFDDIVCERVVGGLPAPVAPRLSARTPDGAEGCLEVRWDPQKLSRGTVRLLIYCEPKPVGKMAGALPKVVADAEEGRATIWSLEKGLRYYVAARAVNADMVASDLGESVEASPGDRQAPRPGWLAAERLPGGRVLVGWSPHVLDLDVARVHLSVPGPGEGRPREIRAFDVEELYEQPRPLFCTEPWLSTTLAVPEGVSRLGVSAEDQAGNRGEVSWVDIQPAPPEQEISVPCVLTTAPPTTQLPRAAGPPAEDQRSSSFELHLTRGESEGFQVLLWPGANLRQVSVHFEPLKSDDGKEEIPTRWLAYHFVNYVHLEKNSRATPRDELVWPGPADYPDELSDDRMRDLVGGELQPIFIRVTAPRETTPGTYRGRAWVQSAQGRLPFDLVVHVLPINFPERTTLKFVYWFSWGDACKQFGVEQFSEDGWRVLLRLGQLMHAYQQNVVVVPWSLVHTWRTQDGRLLHDFRDFDRFLRTFQQAGVDAGFCISHIGSRSTGEWLCPTMKSHEHRLHLLASGQEQRMDAVDLLPAIQRHVEQLGLLDRTMVHVADEPIPQNVASYRELAARVKKAAPRLQRIDAIHVPDLRGALEVWVPQLNYFNQWMDQYLQARQEGYEIWFYVAWVPQGKYPNRMIDSASIKPRVLHWLNFIYDTSGYLHWALNHWHISLMSLQSPGDQYICWPSNRFIANSSLRYEAERDGLDDCELALLTQQALEKRGLSHEQAHARLVALLHPAVRGCEDYTRSWRKMDQVRQALLRRLVELLEGS